MSEKFCTHIKLDGVRCGCMAITGKRYCHFHEHYYDRDRAPKTNQTFEPLPFEDTRSIILTIHQLVRSLLSGNIERGMYHDAVYGLQVAAQYANRPDALSPEAATKLEQEKQALQQLQFALAKLKLAKLSAPESAIPADGKDSPEFSLAQLILDTLAAFDRGEWSMPDIKDNKPNRQ